MDIDVLGPNPDAMLRRDGFRLISTRAAALPVWRTSLRCRILKRSQVSTFTEFVLRAIGLGVNKPEDVTRLLNLPAKLVTGVISELLLDRHLAIESTSDGPLLQLTPAGKTLVSTLVQERVVEESATYYVDGISGDPLTVSRNVILSAADVDADPRLILNPDFDVEIDFGPDDTQRFHAAASQRGERDSTLLSVLGVDSATKQYVSAALLLFESESDPNDRYLRVCVDGRQDERVEELVRERALLDSMRLAHRVDEDRRRVDRLLPTSVLSLREDDSVVEEAAEELSRLQAVTTIDDDEAALEGLRFKVRARIAAMAVRRLSPREAAEVTEVSMLGARDGVLVSASRLWPPARRAHYAKLFRQLNAGGCPVTFETPPKSAMSKSDATELGHISDSLRDSGIEFVESKPANEASFIVIDQASVIIFPGSPFVDVATTSDRLGDDRPTMVRGVELVRAVIESAHGTVVTARGQTAEMSRELPRDTQ